MNVKQIEKNEKIVQGFKNLVQECKKDISIIEENKLFDEKLKKQTLSVLSNITLKMEMIMDIK